MFLTSFPAGPWQTNCYLIAADEQSDVVIVDPGVAAAAQVRRLVSAQNVGVAGIILTHGHIDHIGSVVTLAKEFNVPVWMHAADRELLTDAGVILPDSLALAQEFGVQLGEPDDLRFLVDGDTLDLAGLTFTVQEAPGHRPGCLLWSVGELIFTGDVLFAGSIGRTDLPGGDSDAMMDTLANVVKNLPADATVLPGHGPASTVQRELTTNPYLQPSFLRR